MRPLCFVTLRGNTGQTFLAVSFQRRAALRSQCSERLLLALERRRKPLRGSWPRCPTIARTSRCRSRGSAGQYVVREFFAHRFDPETKHTLLQYAAAMIDRILGMAGGPPPRFAKIEIPPHPVHNVEHLRPWFGDRVVEAEARGITVVIEGRVMERAFSKVARDRLNPRALEAGPRCAAVRRSPIR